MDNTLRKFYREKLLNSILKKDKESENKWNEMLMILTKTEKKLNIKAK